MHTEKLQYFLLLFAISSLLQKVTRKEESSNRKITNVPHVGNIPPDRARGPMGAHRPAFSWKTTTPTSTSREWNDNGAGEGPSSSRGSIFRATSCVRLHVAWRRKVKSCRRDWRLRVREREQKGGGEWGSENKRETREWYIRKGGGEGQRQRDSLPSCRNHCWLTR